jgi:hypothetical protein
LQVNLTVSRWNSKSSKLVPMLESDLEACSIDIKELKQRLDHSFHYKVFSPPCEVCGTLKGKLLHDIKENSELKQEVAYLSSCLERTMASDSRMSPDLLRGTG